MPVSPPLSIVQRDEIFQIIGNTLAFATTDGKSPHEAYKECPPLSYILSNKARLLSNGIVTCVKDTKSEKEITDTSDINRAFLKVIEQPNPLQTFNQYMSQISTMLDLYGYCPVLMVRPVGFEDGPPSELWPIPPSLLTIKPNKQYFKSTLNEMIEEITMTIYGKRVPINIDDIYFYTADTCNIDNLLFPYSRMIASKYPIENIIKNYEGRNSLIANHGALGMISNQAKDSISTLPMDPDEKDKVEKAYSKRYGLGKDQLKVVVTNATLKYDRITMDMAELQLLENAEDDIKTLCDTFGYKYALLSRGGDTTFNNQNEIKKSQYQDYTIPEAESIIRQTNELANTKAAKVKYEIDYSHLPIFQENEKERAEVLSKNVTSGINAFKNNLCTYTDLVKRIGISEPPTQWKNKYWYELNEQDRATFGAMVQSNNQNQNSNNDGSE